jgi:hypothetical protein
MQDEKDVRNVCMLMERELSRETASAVNIAPRSSLVHPRKDLLHAEARVPRFP